MATKTQKFIIGFLTLVVLTASIYIMLPESVRIDVQQTKTTFKVWENNSWVLSGTEYTKIYDGTTLMKANSRVVNYTVDLETNQSTIYRYAYFKDNISVIDVYQFDGNTESIELVPVSHEIIVQNGQGKILVYEVNDLLYSGETINPVASPQEFGHNMKVEWEEGNYYSRIFKYSGKDVGKLEVKYRIDSENYSKEVRLFDPSTRGAIYTTSSPGYYPSLTIDSNGIIHTASIDDTLNALIYCNNTGGSWSCANLGAIGDDSSSAKGTDIKVDNANKIHIIFTNMSASPVSPGYCNNVAGSWACSLIFQDATQPSGHNPSMTIDSKDYIHVSFDRINDEGYIYCNNTAGSWSCAQQVFQTNSYKEPNKMLANSTESIFLLYQDESNGDLSYYTKLTAASAWTGPIDIKANAANYDFGPIDAQIDSNGKMHVVYDDDAADDLIYCNNTGAWSCATIESEGDKGNYPKMVVDSSNKVHIMSVDSDNSDIRYCNNVNTVWRCMVADANSGFLYFSRGGRAAEIKKGRISTSTSFMTEMYYDFYYLGDLYYINQTFLPLPDISSPNFTAYGGTYNSFAVNLNFTVSNSSALSKCLYTTDNYVTNVTVNKCISAVMTLTSSGSKTVKLWVNDSTGAWNEDQVTFTIDTSKPTYSLNQTNSTLAGQSVLFSIYVNDSASNLHPNGGYIFSTNNTGSWVNNTVVNFITTPSWANVTKVLNSTVGLKIGYRWYFNDTVGNMNSTEIYVLTTTADIPADTCTCAGSGVNWQVNMSHNCNLTTVCNLGTGNLSWIGTSGYFNCSAQLNLTRRSAPPSGTIFYFKSGCRINH